MRFLRIKKQIVKYGNYLIEKGLTKSTGGNISVFIREKNLVLMTPSSVPYKKIKAKDIIEMKLDGTQLSSFHYKPSSEWQMHTVVYQNREDINAMVHSHSIFSMVVSATQSKLPAIDYLVAFSGSHEVPVVNYATYGSAQLANNSLQVLKKMNAVILQNHGINVIGVDLSKAIDSLELLELCAEMYCRSLMIGKPNILPKEELIKLSKTFVKGNYGTK